MYAARGGGSFRRVMADPMEQVSRLAVSDSGQVSEGIMLESAESAHSSHGVAADVRSALGITRYTSSSLIS